MHTWAKDLMAKCVMGAILSIDNELWPEPKWKITKKEISVTSGNCTLCLVMPGDDPEEVQSEMKGRIRVLIDAPALWQGER